MGYKVITASSGQEAVDIYRVDKDRIDMVILDMIMPGMGGEETLERLRAFNDDIKVILSSGYSLDSEMKRILNGNANRFLQKPFRIDQWSQKIRSVLRDVASIAES